MADETDYACSFCGRPRANAAVIITAHPASSVCICEVCVALCVDIIADAIRRSRNLPTVSEPLPLAPADPEGEG